MKSLQTPIEVFQLCYHTIVEAVDPEQTDIEPDFTLAYQLVPSLLILALSLAADQKSKQEEFALYFRSLITARLTLDPLFFSFDIGHMVSELIFFIYDYLVEFDQNRKTLHLYIVPNLVVRNRVNRFDDEYSGVLAMLKTVKAMDVARLAFAAKAYHKAQYYLEKSYCEKQEVGLKDIPLNEFLQENLSFLGRIYVGMKDEDNVRGVSRMREGPFPKVEDMMNVALAEGDSLAGLMAGAKMVLEDR